MTTNQRLYGYVIQSVKSQTVPDLKIAEYPSGPTISVRVMSTGRQVSFTFVPCGHTFHIHAAKSGGPTAGVNHVRVTEYKGNGYFPDDAELKDFADNVLDSYLKWVIEPFQYIKTQRQIL